MTMTSTPDRIARLADWLAAVQADDIPDEAFERLRLQVLDHLGCAVLGADTNEHRRFRVPLQTMGNADDATVVLGGSRAGATVAAMTNATSISRTELTVGIGRAHVHPGTQAIPVALAEAERTGADGLDVLRAVALGYEVAIRLGWSMSHLPGEPLNQVRPQLMLRGWYTPAILGGFAAAAAAAAIRRLDAGRIRDAFGIVGNLAPTALYAGAKSGAVVKSVSEGWAAAIGLFAVDLAERGLGGVPNIADHLFPLLVGDAERIDFERIDEGLGERWELLDFGRNQTMFSASRTSSITDCAFQLRDDHGLVAGEIEEVVVRTTSRFKLLDTVAPPNEQAAKFSIPYSVAQVLLGRRREEMLDEAFTEAAFRAPDWQDLARRVRVVADPEFDAAFETHPRVSTPSQIDVVLRDGAHRSNRTDGYFGLSGKPEVDPRDFDRKFRHLAARRLPEGAAERALELVLALGRHTDIRALMALFSQPREPGDAVPT